MNRTTVLDACVSVCPEVTSSLLTTASLHRTGPTLALAVPATSSPTASSPTASSPPIASPTTAAPASADNTGAGADYTQNDQGLKAQIPPPAIKPGNPCFSSGPCAKPPGWSVNKLTTKWLGRSHRASGPKAQLSSAIDRCKNLMQLPDDWVLGIVPGSDTGAFEMSMWSLLGSRAVDALVWESFSADWSKDLQMLDVPALNVLSADYGDLPDLAAIDSTNDLVLVANGTTSGVRLPDFDFIASDREGLVLCDATSAVFAMPLDYDKLDVITWSWQKVLGSEAAHGMLALSPRAVERLSQPAPRPVPKLFRLANNGKLISGIFDGSTINTPSMLAVSDLHVALDWAESIGGASALQERTAANFRILDEWVQKCAWIEWLPSHARHRSTTSMCLTICSPRFTELDDAAQKSALKVMLGQLDKQDVAYDIANYRSAPNGFRIWGGATVEQNDLKILTQWLDWVWSSWLSNQQTAKTMQSGEQQ